MAETNHTFWVKHSASTGIDMMRLWVPRLASQGGGGGLLRHRGVVQVLQASHIRQTQETRAAQQQEAR